MAENDPQDQADMHNEPEGNVARDGERYPMNAFELRLFTVLSMLGTKERDLVIATIKAQVEISPYTTCLTSLVW